MIIVQGLDLGEIVLQQLDCYFGRQTHDLTLFQEINDESMGK